MNIKKMVEELDYELNQEYRVYTQLHEELNKYRGKSLDDENIHEVNRILKEIQEVFSEELYPAYHLITHRHQYAVNALNSYNDFIETLKKAGATQQ